MQVTTNIVCFDGVCVLCNKSVQRLIRIDKKEKLRYTSLQGEYCSQNSSAIPDVDSIVFIQKNATYVKSSAVLRILICIGGVYKMAWLGYLCPRVIRDWFYDCTAKKRYRKWGKLESCPVPDPKHKHLFIP